MWAWQGREKLPRSPGPADFVPPLSVAGGVRAEAGPGLGTALRGQVGGGRPPFSELGTSSARLLRVQLRFSS